MNHWHDIGFILGDLPTGVVLPALHSLFLMSEKVRRISITAPHSFLLMLERDEIRKSGIQHFRDAML